MKKPLLLLTIPLLLSVAACTHQSPVCETDTISFATEVQPIFTSNCNMSGCHNSQDRAEGVNLSSYSGAANQVKAGNPSSSELYEVITATGSKKMPPAGSPALSADQISTIKTWIEQGAENTDCP
jgi:uncharacterized membrane protein